MIARIVASILLAYLCWTFAVGQQHQLNTAGKAGLELKRQEWLFQQRAYPLGYIPAGARLKALEQLRRMKEEKREWLAAHAHTTAGSPMQWNLIGPQPIIPGGGSAGFDVSGHVEALAIDPRNINAVYLGAFDGGVWKTTDGGSTWNPMTDSQPSLAIGSIALDPSAPDIVYAGTGDGILYGVGLLKSTDGGATWTYIPGPFKGPFGSNQFFSGGDRIYSLAVRPTNGSILLAAVWLGDLTQSGIYRSADGGNTWTQAFSGARGAAVYFDPTNGNIAYAALGDGYGSPLDGVYKSTDGGQTWAPANGTGTNVLPSANAGQIILALAPSSPSTLYAAVFDVASGQPIGLFRTADGALNWTKLPALPEPPQTLRVDPANDKVVLFGGHGNLYRSVDGGQSWTQVVATGDFRSLAMAPDGSKLYIGDDRGAFSTTDLMGTPLNLTDLNATLAITQFYPGLSIHPTNVNTGFGGTQDNGVDRYDGNLAWEFGQNCDGGWTAIDFLNPSTVYADCASAPGNMQIFKSTSNGDFLTWSPALNGIDVNDRVSFIPPLVIDPSNAQRLYFGTFRLYQTNDGAGSWTAISPDLTAGSYFTITTIAVAPSDSNTVYVGSIVNTVQVTTSAAAGTGASWRSSGPGLPNRNLTQIAVEPGISTTAYVTFSGFSGFGDTLGHVFKTTDSGMTWTDISGNLPNIPADDIVIDPDFAKTIYVATDIGVFNTSDGGATWSPLGNGLPLSQVFSLKLHRPTRILRAATYGRSVWDLQLPSVPSPVGVSSASLSFGNQAVGTTSTVQTITLTNNGTAPLTIYGIVAGTDFAQTNTCRSKVAPAGNCTMSVTFTPTASGAVSDQLTITDDAPGQPQAVNLTGTGTGPGVSFSSTSLAFGGQVVGTNSAAQTLTLKNTGNDTLKITGIAVSGDFAETNTCGASVAAAAQCAISITFTPTTSGNRAGTLTLTDNAAGSPQTISLSGAGEDFSITASSGSSTTATVAPGQSATYSLSVSGQGGLKQPISLSCSGAPAEATCTVSPTSVTPNGSSASSVTVNVTTTAPSLAAPRPRIIPPSTGEPSPLLWLLALVTLASLAIAKVKPIAKGLRVRLALLCVLLFVTLAMPGCGGGGGGGGNPGTPAGSYSLTVTGSVTSGGPTLTHNVTLKLTVQ